MFGYVTFNVKYYILSQIFYKKSGWLSSKTNKQKNIFSKDHGKNDPKLTQPLIGWLSISLLTYLVERTVGTSKLPQTQRVFESPSDSYFKFKINSLSVS